MNSHIRNRNNRVESLTASELESLCFEVLKYS